MAGCFERRSNAQVQAAGCEVRVERGVHSDRHGLRVGQRLARVVLVPEAQALQEWCALAKDCCCCLEAVCFLYLWFVSKSLYRWKLTRHSSGRSQRPTQDAGAPTLSRRKLFIL